MKTKAYKLRERIARYIYKSFTKAGYKVDIVWSGKWYGVVELGGNYNDNKYIDTMTSIEKRLGIIIANFFRETVIEMNYPILWDKYKEERYATPIIHSKEWHDEWRDIHFIQKGR